MAYGNPFNPNSYLNWRRDKAPEGGKYGSLYSGSLSDMPDDPYRTTNDIFPGASNPYDWSAIAGIGPSRGETKVTADGLVQKGTNTGVKPMDIPDFVRNPFSSVQLPQTGDHNSVASVPTQMPLTDVGESLGKISGSYSDQGAKTGNKEIPMDSASAIGAGAAKYKETPETSEPEKIDWMQDQRTDNEMARRAAFLDPNLAGKGPMAQLDARNAAMGGIREVKDGRYTGNMLMKTEDDDTTGTLVSKEQWSDYTNRGQDFLKDVMSGTIKLGKDKSEKPGTESVYETDTVDFNPDLAIETFGSMKSGGNPGVDYFGEQPYTDVPVLPDLMSEITGNTGSMASPLPQGMTHEQISALPKIKGPNGELVPDLRSFYK